MILTHIFSACVIIIINNKIYFCITDFAICQVQNTPLHHVKGHGYLCLQYWVYCDNVCEWSCGVHLEAGRHHVRPDIATA